MISFLVIYEAYRCPCVVGRWHRVSRSYLSIVHCPFVASISMLPFSIPDPATHQVHGMACKL
jgi:hypothetical protein